MVQYKKKTSKLTTKGYNQMMKILKIKNIPNSGRLRALITIDLDNLSLSNCSYFVRKDGTKYLRLSNSYDSVTKKVVQLVKPRTKLKNEQIQRDWQLALLEWKSLHPNCNLYNKNIYNWQEKMIPLYH